MLYVKCQHEILFYDLYVTTANDCINRHISEVNHLEARRNIGGGGRDEWERFSGRGRRILGKIVRNSRL